MKRDFVCYDSLDELNKIIFNICFSGTARDDIYFEQQFIVTGGLDCRLKSTIYTRLTERSILTWIQDITGKMDNDFMNRFQKTFV